MFTTYAKATVATVLAFLGSLKLSLGDNTISYQEMVEIAIVTVTVFGGTWATPNRP